MESDKPKTNKSYVLTFELTDKDIERMGLTEEFSSAESDLEKEDFLYETIKAALTVYGQANKCKILSDDYYSLDTSKMSKFAERQER